MRQARTDAVERIISRETAEQYRARALLEVANALIGELLAALTPSKRSVLGPVLGPVLAEELAVLETNLAKLREYADGVPPVMHRREPRGPRKPPE